MFGLFRAGFYTAFLATLAGLSPTSLHAQPRLEARLEYPHSGSDTLTPVFSPDGSIVATSNTYSVVLWNVKTGKNLGTLCSGQLRMHLVSISPDGQTLCAAGQHRETDEQRFEIWNLISMARMYSFTPKAMDKHDVLTACFSPNGKYLAFVLNKPGKMVYIYDLAVGTSHSIVDCGFRASCLCFDNTSKRLVIGGWSFSETFSDEKLLGHLTFLELETGVIQKVRISSGIYAMACHPKSNLLYSCGNNNDRYVRKWDVVTAKEVDKLQISNDFSGQGHISFSKDGKYVATSGYSSIMIYKTFEEQVKPICLNPGVIFSYPHFTFSPVANLLAVHGSDKSSSKLVLELWSVDSSQRTSRKSISESDQFNLEQQIEAGEPIGVDYFKAFGKAKFEVWRVDEINGCKYGQFLKGCYLIQGISGNTYKEHAIELFEKSAAQGNHLAWIYLASLESKNPKRAFELFTKAADTKSPLAIEYLAGCYRDGIGVEKDMTKAFSLSLAASEGENGLSAAMISVGLAYLNGVGVAKAPDRAFEWFTKAAARSHPDAFYHLGMCHLNGIGVKQDSKQAVKLFEIGCSKNSTQAKFGLAFCKERGEGCNKDLKTALALYQALAQKNIKVAMAKATEIEAFVRPNRAESKDSHFDRYQSLPANGSGASAGAIRSRAIYEAQQAARDAQRDYWNHTSGQLGAYGLIPLRVPH